jgi:hypothetical protein
MNEQGNLRLFPRLPKGMFPIHFLIQLALKLIPSLLPHECE